MIRERPVSGTRSAFDDANVFQRAAEAWVAGFSKTVA